MTPGGADGQHGNGKGKGNALPSDYVPPGGVRTNTRDANTLGGSLSGTPALNAAASGQPLDAESLKAEVEALHLRRTAQQATIRSLAEANDDLIASVEAMRQEGIESDARATKSRRKTKSKAKVKRDPKGGESSSSRPEPIGQATERRDQKRKPRKKARKIRKETKLARSTSSVENANMSAANGRERFKLVQWDNFLVVIRLRRIPGFPVVPVVELRLRVLGHVIGRCVSTIPPGSIQGSFRL